LISRPGNGLHRGAAQVESGQSLKKPVKAKLRRMKPRFSPLQPQLLTTKRNRRKE
jgi:hypothetical protein